MIDEVEVLARLAGMLRQDDDVQKVLQTVVEAGIKAILNFSPGTFKVPDDVKIKSVDLTVSLESLSFFLAQGDIDEA